MLDLLRAAMKGGIKTSEFWLAVLALLVPVLDTVVTKVLDAITGLQASAHSPVILAVLAGAAAFVSAAYSVARALLKKETVTQLAAPATLQALPNTLTMNPAGTAADERARAIRAGASPNDLGTL